VEKELVTEYVKNCETTRLGRRPIQLKINDHFGYIIGMEIHPMGITLSAITMGFKVLDHKRFQLEVDHHNLDTHFFQSLETFSKRPKLIQKKLIGIGVAIPGIIDTDNHLILKSEPLKIIETPYDFHKNIQSKTTIPTLLGNDANCCAYNILVKNRSKETHNFLYAYLGLRTKTKESRMETKLGLGLGIVINGQVYSGPQHSAGEIKSIYCKDGVESQFSFSQTELQELLKNTNKQELLTFEIAQNLSLIINTLNFSHFFIGGNTEYLSITMKEVFSNEIHKNRSYTSLPKVNIHVDEEEHVVSLGAAAFFLEKLFHVPENNREVYEKFHFWDSILQRIYP